MGSGRGIDCSSLLPPGSSLLRRTQPMEAWGLRKGLDVGPATLHLVKDAIQCSFVIAYLGNIRGCTNCHGGARQPGCCLRTPGSIDSGQKDKGSADRYGENVRCLWLCA